MSQDINRVKKISVATVCGKLSADIVALLKAGETVFVGRFFGSATDSKKGVSQYGPWVAVTGNFRGVNADGEVFQGPQMLLPLGICEAIAEQLASGAESVEVMVDIHAKYKSIGGQDGYEFFAKTQEAPETEDPLALMQKAMPALPSNKTKQLALEGATVAQEAPALVSKGKAKA